jgi:hypothetical protein
LLLRHWLWQRKGQLLLLAGCSHMLLVHLQLPLLQLLQQLAHDLRLRLQVPVI